MDHVTLEIRPGEMYGLLGPNGAGKTTTIRMITTLLKPATGMVSVFGVVVLVAWTLASIITASLLLPRLANR